MLIRVRSKFGTWRLGDVESRTKVGELMARIEHEHGVKVGDQALRLSAGSGGQVLRAQQTCGELGVKHGSMVYLTAAGGSASASSAAAGSSGTSKTKKCVDANGNLMHSAKDEGSKAFRPGALSLRAQKMHWTLTDMMELDDQYTFKIKGEKQTFCERASLDSKSCDAFQRYVRSFAFQTSRCGYMYGVYLDPKSEEEEEEEKGGGYVRSKPRKMVLSDLPSASKNTLPKQSVRVEFVYEPCQIGTPSGFDLLDDEREQKAEAIASALGYRRVGFIFSHPRRKDYNFSAREIIQAGQQCLEAGEGAFDSPFVIVKVFPEEDGSVAFDAFQLTPQCLEMVAEDALLELPSNPGHSAVHETFTAVVEAKKAEVIDNDFFIKRVPIVSHASALKGGGDSTFPRYNRDNSEVPSSFAFQSAMKSLGRNPSTKDLIARIANFHVLMFLAEHFGISEMRDIAAHVKTFAVDGDADAAASAFPEGYKLMILSLANLC